MSRRPGGALWPRLAAAALLAGHGALAWIGRGPGILTRQDDALYIILARSLLKGSYRDLHRLGTPLHSLYPPGYPAELALWGGLFGFRFNTIVLFSVLCSVLALFLIWQATDRLFSPWLAVAVLAPLALNPLLLDAAGNVASEAPFLVLTAAALWLAGRPGETGQPPGRRWIVLIGAFALVASVTRAAGVALLGGLLLDWFLARRWRAVVVFGALSAVVFAGWLAFSGHVSREVGAKSYVPAITAAVIEGPGEPGKPVDTGPPSAVAAWAGRLAEHARFYAFEGGPWAMAVPTVPGTPIDNIASTAIALLAGLAGIVILFGRWRAASLYLLVYSAMLLVYAWLQARFVVPIVPFAALACLVGADWWARRLGWKPLRVLLPALLSLGMVYAGSVRSFHTIRDRSFCDRTGEYPDPRCMRADQRSWFDAVRYIRERLPAHAVVLSMKPEPLFYYTGHQSAGTLDIAYPPDSGFIGRVRAEGADYILLGSLQAQEPGRLSRRMMASCDSLTLEAFFPERTYLFRVATPTSAAGRRAACEAMARYRAANIGRNFGGDP